MEPLTAAKTEKVKVTFLPKETATRVPAGTTLFHAAAWTGQPIESTCGGRGTCGKCRVQVIQGSVPVTPADLQHLAKEDIADGWRLIDRRIGNGERADPDTQAAVRLFVVRSGGAVHMASDGAAPQESPGDTVITLSPAGSS